MLLYIIEHTHHDTSILLKLNGSFLSTNKTSNKSYARYIIYILTACTSNITI